MLASFWSRHSKPIAGSVCLVLVAFCYYSLQPGGFLKFLIGLGPCDEIFCDFAHQYYTTGVKLVTKPEPTSSYFYSLFFGLFLSIFGRMPLETAIAWWWLFQAISLLLLLLPALELGRKQPWVAVIYLGLVLFYEPVLNNLKWGQVSVFMTGCVLSSWVCYRHGYRRTAVVLLAIPTAIKYYTGIFLLFYLFKKDWRSAAEYVGVTAGLLLLPVAIFGFQANWEFYQTIQENLERSQRWIQHSHGSQYFANVANRYVQYATPLENSYRWLEWLGYAWFGFNLAFIWKYRVRFRLHDELMMALLFLSLPFLLRTCWPHYFVYLPFCQAAILLAIWANRKTVTETNRPSWLSVFAPYRYYLLYVSMVLPSIFCYISLPTFSDYVLYGCVLWSNMLLMLCLYSLFLRPERDTLDSDGRTVPV